MKLFPQIAGATLAAMCLMGAASAASAHHVQPQPYSPSATQSLLRDARDVGVQIFTDNDANGRRACSREGLLGMANNKHQLMICVKNHGDRVDELADTIRHELVHTAQYCKGRLVGATSALLYPQDAEKGLKAARDYLHMPMDYYEPSQYTREAEARVLAQIYNEEQIGQLLYRYCKI